MILRTAAERPEQLSLFLGYREFVDAGVARGHQTVVVEFPVLVAVGPKPLMAIVAIFLSIAHCDPRTGKGPQFLDQAIFVLARLFAGEEFAHFFTPDRKFDPVAPARVGRIGQRNPIGIAAVPAIFGKSHLLRGGFEREGRQRRTTPRKYRETSPRMPVGMPGQAPQAGQRLRA